MGEMSDFINQGGRTPPDICPFDAISCTPMGCHFWDICEWRLDPILRMIKEAEQYHDEWEVE